MRCKLLSGSASGAIRRRCSYSGIALLSLAMIAVTSRGQAAEVTMTFDPSLSLLTLESNFSDIALVSQPGGPGDTSPFAGQMTISVDDPLAPTTIQFVDASLESQVTGNWLPEIGGGSEGDPEVMGDGDPGNPAPGSYGMFLDAGATGKAWGSFRDMVITITSDPQTVSNGTFDTGQLFQLVGGTWDTLVVSELLGDAANSDDITGEQAFNDSANGTYQVSQGVARLTLPVEIYFPGDVDFNFQGTLVATANVGPTVKGDFDASGILDLADINLLSAAQRSGTNPPAFDLNGDASVNGEDRRIWVEDLRKTWIGDANLDGIFDSSDFVQVFQAGQYEDATGGNSAWETGDWNGDGDFDSGDFVVAFQGGGFEKGTRAATAVVPEPVGASLIGAALVGLVSWCLVSRR